MSPPGKTPNAACWKPPTPTPTASSMWAFSAKGRIRPPSTPWPFSKPAAAPSMSSKPSAARCAPPPAKNWATSSARSSSSPMWTRKPGSVPPGRRMAGRNWGKSCWRCAPTTSASRTTFPNSYTSTFPSRRRWNAPSSPLPGGRTSAFPTGNTSARPARPKPPLPASSTTNPPWPKSSSPSSNRRRPPSRSSPRQ